MPNSTLRSYLAFNFLLAGECDQALPLLAALSREAPDDLSMRASYALAAVCTGNRTEALKVADALAKVDRPFLRGAHLFERARVLAALGDRERAMRALQAAFAQGYPWNGTEMHLNISMDPLRDYPPFVELMKPKG